MENNSTTPYDLTVNYCQEPLSSSATQHLLSNIKKQITNLVEKNNDKINEKQELLEKILQSSNWPEGAKVQQFFPNRFINQNWPYQHHKQHSYNKTSYGINRYRKYLLRKLH